MAHLWSAGRHYSVISIVRYPNISLRYCEATYSEQLAKSRTSFPPFSLLLFFILLLWQENCCWTSLLSSPPVIVSRESKTPITLLLNVASMWRLHVHTHTLSCPCLPCVSGLSTPVSRGMWCDGLWIIDWTQTHDPHVIHFPAPTHLLHKTSAWLLRCFVHLDTVLWWETLNIQD